MKKALIPVLIGLLAWTVSARAISITVLEQSATRLDFTVIWGPVPTDGTAQVPGGPLPRFHILADERFHPSIGPFIFLEVDTTIGTYFDDQFLIDWPGEGPDRPFSSAMIGGFGGFEGTQLLPLEGNEYGARFVYGEALPTTGAPVPEGGGTLMLLAGALGTLGWAKRRVLTTP